MGFGGLKPPHGALAEHVVVPAAYTAPIPDGIEPPTAAALSSAITAMCMRTVEWVRAGTLTVPIVTMPLSRIAEAWTRTGLRGRRLVIVPD